MTLYLQLELGITAQCLVALHYFNFYYIFSVVSIQDCLQFVVLVHWKFELPLHDRRIQGRKTATHHRALSKTLNSPSAPNLLRLSLSHNSTLFNAVLQIPTLAIKKTKRPNAGEPTGTVKNREVVHRAEVERTSGKLAKVLSRWMGCF
jgi:hypothetical protein